MQKYYAQLGNTPALSIQELNSVIGSSKVIQVSDYLATIQLDSDQEAIKLIDKLGGCIKIIKEILKFSDLSEQNIVKTTADHLIKKSNKKIHFGFCEHGRDHLPKINAHDIKSIIEQNGQSARFINGSRHGLSASVLIHKKRVVEMCVIQTKNGVFLGETVATQNIDLWTLKDRGKPYFDKKKGMLPPKVAKMMLNIALGDNQVKETKQKLLLDPFMGTGTILIEALLSNLDVIGSDIDPLAVDGTKKNLEWLSSQLEIESKYRVFLFDASKIPAQESTIDYIVTEPFLGKPKPNLSKLPFIYKGLTKMYLGAFKHWRKLLADKASIVIVFPKVDIKDKKGRVISYNLDKLIDKLAALGYTTLSKPILYHRPNAVVQRQIYRFKFKK